VICLGLYLAQHIPLLPLGLGFLFVHLALSKRGGSMSTRRKLMLASWSEPSEGSIHGTITCNAEPIQQFINKKSQGSGPKLSVTTVVLKAFAVAFREAPTLNCAIVDDKFVEHKSIDISCLVALDDGKDLASAKIVRADEKSLDEIHNDIRAKAEKLRAHKDADFEASKPLLKLLPVTVIRVIVTTVGYLAGQLGLNIPALGVRPFPFGSAMVTSLGMLGVDQGFIPFTPFAKVPMLLMVGAIKKAAIVNAEGQVAVQSQLILTATLDHRYVDGTEAARLAKRLSYLVEHPEEIDAGLAPLNRQKPK